MSVASVIKHFHEGSLECDRERNEMYAGIELKTRTKNM